ncbi:DUF932 domain-containing protein [Nonomuraea sp. GTA35]|uniref:DUF932 domain-containing protein n=1 Tax=Nonomuraea sp. GTA35 TaxID=1676746 RepID=UPI0035C03305
MDHIETVLDHELSIGSAALVIGNAKRVKIKHSRRSLDHVVDVRDAVGIIHQIADSFAAEVHRLCQIDVSRKDWTAFLDPHAPVPAEHGRKTRATAGWGARPEADTSRYAASSTLSTACCS